MEKPEAQIRMTTPRRKIYELFIKHHERHLTAEEVHDILKQQGDQVGLATVYRVLAQFTESGILARHMFNQQAAVYEIEDHSHDHIVCVTCGDILEFVCSEIQKIKQELAQEKNYILNDHKLVLYGTCSN